MTLVLICWHARFIKDSLNLELLDLLDGFVEEVLKLSLDDLLLVEELVNVVNSALLGSGESGITSSVNDTLVLFEPCFHFCAARVVN